MNCYCHFVRLVVQVPQKEPHILFIREGTIQGDAFAMILNGIGMLLLVDCV